MSGYPLKSNTVTCINNFAVKNFSLLVKLNVSNQAFIGQHDFAPTHIKYRRTDFTVPFFCSFFWMKLIKYSDSNVHFSHYPEPTSS